MIDKSRKEVKARIKARQNKSKSKRKVRVKAEAKVNNEEYFDVCGCHQNEESPSGEAHPSGWGDGETKPKETSCKTEQGAKLPQSKECKPDYISF